jgi:Domain of unknown function (DUF5077)
MLGRLAKTNAILPVTEMWMNRQWNLGLLTLLLWTAGDSSGANPTVTDWGEIRWLDRGLELHVADARVPNSGTVRIPRLNNPVAAIYLQGDKDRAPLKLTPHVAEWEIALPPCPERFGRLVVVIETVGAPRLASQPRLLQPAASGVITLPAHEAVTHGELLRYEPQPHKDTVGYWSRQEDWCEWHFATARPGRYEVQILQGCGKGQGGSEVALRVGGQEIVFTIEETGHFQNFTNRTLGTVEIAAGTDHTLELRPRTKAAAAVMDVRQLRLIPVDAVP